MRRKPLPPPPEDPSILRAAQAALPLVPGSEADCCARLRDRLGLPGRDVAGAWLSLLCALDLAEEHDHGFARTRSVATETALSAAFLDGIFAAREVHAALVSADEPLDAAAAFEATAAIVPGWERAKHGAAWRDVWRERTGDLLEWLELLGLAEQTDGGYRPADGGQ